MVATFKITRDLVIPEIADTFPDLKSREGRTFCPRGQTPAAEDTLDVEFRIYDDDGELYYEGIVNEPGLELALDWATWDAGATRIDAKFPGDADFSQYIS